MLPHHEHPSHEVRALLTKNTHRRLQRWNVVVLTKCDLADEFLVFRLAQELKGRTEIMELIKKDTVLGSKT
jgi:hypothetical protein